VLFAESAFIRFRRVAAPDVFLPRLLLSRVRRAFMSIGNAIAAAAAVSLAAWLGSLPLIYWYFHLITPVSLLANLVIVPIAYFVLALATLSVIVAPFSVGLSIIFNNANWLLSRAVLALVHLFAGLPASHIYLQRITEARPPIAITVLDEGTGAAAHVRANGHDWLLDCGGWRSYERTLKSFLHSRGVNRLDGLLLTHGDAQHIGGAADIVIDFKPRQIYDNPLDVRSNAQRRLRELLRAAGKWPRHLARGDRLVLGPNVDAEILYPPPDLRVASADDAPLVARLTLGKTSALFESDAGLEAESALLRYGDNLRSNILIKGQHQTGGSGSVGFINAIQPKLIIATSRESPVAERLDEQWASDIAQRGIKLFRQDVTGAVEIEFHDGGWIARTYATGETFRSSNR